MESSVLRQAPASYAVAASGHDHIGSPGSGTRREQEFWRLTHVVLARWKTIVPVVLLSSGLVGFALRYLPPTYMATAEILIDQEQLEYADLAEDAKTPRTSILPTEVETYMKTLASDRLARDVVETVGPAAFVRRESPLVPLRAWYHRTVSPAIQPILDKLLFLLPPLDRRLELPALSAESDRADAAGRLSPMDQAVDVFQSQIEFERDPLAALISISYRTGDPAQAAQIANAAANAFLNELVRVQKEALAASADYLRERAEALAAELEADDTAAVSLRRKLSDFGDGSLTQLRYGELLRSLSEAEAELVEKRNDAALAVGRVGFQGDAVDPVLTELRQKDAQLSAKLAELSSDLQARHPQVVTTRAEQAEVRARIQAEENRIRRQTRSDLDVGQAKVDWIRRELAKIEQQMASDMNDQLALKQLSTRTDSTRVLYQDILTRYQRSREQQLMVRAPARVIRAARLPGRPEESRQWLIITAVAIGSFAATAGLALFLELRRKAYRSVHELRRDLSQPIMGTLPVVEWSFTSSGPAAIERDIQRRVFAESLRRAALRLQPTRAQDELDGSVILVTSALPGEGKTVVTLSLGRQLAKSGNRVLVIDGDMHKRALNGQLGLLPRSKEDLVSVMAADPEERAAKLANAITSDPRLGVDFLLAQRRCDDPVGLLSSAAMAEIVRDLRKRYDIILVDSAPALAVADTMAMLPFTDRVLFVVRWDSTPRQAVALALDEIASHGSRSCGLLLNAVDLHSYPRHAANDYVAHLGLSAGYAR